MLIACLGILIRSNADADADATKKPLPKTTRTKSSHSKLNHSADSAGKDWLKYRQKLAPFLEFQDFAN